MPQQIQIKEVIRGLIFEFENTIALYKKLTFNNMNFLIIQKAYIL